MTQAHHRSPDTQYDVVTSSALGVTADISVFADNGGQGGVMAPSPESVQADDTLSAAQLSSAQLSYISMIMWHNLPYERSMTRHGQLPMVPRLTLYTQLPRPNLLTLSRRFRPCVGWRLSVIWRWCEKRFYDVICLQVGSNRINNSLKQYWLKRHTVKCCSSLCRIIDDISWWRHVALQPWCNTCHTNLFKNL